jgi:hypothetical protein
MGKIYEDDGDSDDDEYEYEIVSKRNPNFKQKITRDELDLLTSQVDSGMRNHSGVQGKSQTRFNLAPAEDFRGQVEDRPKSNRSFGGTAANILKPSQRKDAPEINNANYRKKIASFGKQVSERHAPADDDDGQIFRNHHQGGDGEWEQDDSYEEVRGGGKFSVDQYKKGVKMMKPNIPAYNKKPHGNQASVSQKGPGGGGSYNVTFGMDEQPQFAPKKKTGGRPQKGYNIDRA